MKLKRDKTSKIVREMTLQEKAESIINLINHKDINAECLYNWQIDAMKEMCEKQIPKKPLEQRCVNYEIENELIGHCPSCRLKWDVASWQRHCSNCGQRLDWSVEE